MREILWRLLKIKRKMCPSIKVGSIPFLQDIPNYFQNYLRQFPIEVQAHKMFLDKLDTLQLGMNRIYEPEMTTFFRRHLSPGGIVLDIGAHIGYYSLIFAEAVGPSGKVFAFEPNPENYRLLLKNIRINKFQNIEPINKAVSDKTGVLNLYESDSNSGDHRIYDSGEKRKQIRIQALKIDDLISEMEQPLKLIKMDIQGAEYYALNGMISLINKSEDLLLSAEFWPYGLKMSGVVPESFIALLFKLGFTVYEFGGSEMVKINSASQLTEKYRIEEPSSYTNLICKKGRQNICVR
jgi:FkbM family methyltransferase